MNLLAPQSFRLAGYYLMILLLAMESFLSLKSILIMLLSSMFRCNLYLMAIRQFNVNLDDDNVDLLPHFENIRASVGINVGGFNVVRQVRDEHSNGAFFDTVVSCEQEAVRFRMKQNSLYNIGFENHDGWHEVADSSLIPNSARLGFSSPYSSMADVGGSNISNVNVSIPSFRAAIWTLSSRNYSSDQAKAHAFTQSTAILCEGVRLFTVADHVSSQEARYGSAYLSSKMTQCVNNWKQLSIAIRTGNQTKLVRLLPGETIPNARDNIVALYHSG